MLLLEAFLNDDHSSNFKTKSSSTSLNSLLEETNNFDNYLPEFTTFSKVLFDAKYESDSSDDQSSSDEDVLEKIVSKPLRNLLIFYLIGTEQSSLGCSSVPFLSPLIRSSMGEFGPAHLTLNKRFVGGKISGKSTIKTKTLNFKNVLYVKELQHFNLISVSQICDQTHRVLFTKNKCLVLSKDFPLPDPSMVILSILRKHNLYTFRLNELAPKGPLNYLIAKASQTESTLCNARTPQQNGVSKRKNRTLIEAARTMLADSLLPTIFWTEVVATACYVLNKFDKKSDESYIVGYSISSKAYKVYNLVSRKIEETMNLIFLKNKPFVAGTGQAWMFDINYLTDSLNYSRVSSTNLIARSQGAKPSNASSQEDDSDSDDEPDVLIIHFTPTLVVPIVDEATTQNDGTESDHATTNAYNLNELTELQALQRQEQAGKEEADQLGLAFPSLNLILGVGSAPIGSSVSAGSTPPVSAGSTPPMSLCASPISDDRHFISVGKCYVSAGRPTGSVGRPVSAGKPTGSASRPVSAGRLSGSAARTPVPAGRILGKLTSNTSFERFPRASSVENLDIHDDLKIFDCPKSGIFTSSSYDEDFSGPDANNLESSLNVNSTITKRIHNIHPTSQVKERQENDKIRSKPDKNGMRGAYCVNFKKFQAKRTYNESPRLPSFSAITPNEPVLSTEEPDNSLSMGDEHLDTIPTTESDELIKSSVENLVPIPSESEVSVNTARQVNAADSKTTVKAARSMSNLSKTGNPQIDLQDKGVIDSRCLRHMIENMSYLIYYEEIDGGYVAFGGNPNGEKITRK
nr:hypothetical protein [Tanacetum cinerariifolium]